MDQKILSNLGDYLLAHHEEIVGEWLRAVEQNPDISSLDHLKDKVELFDHLPELCQNLAELLKSPQSDQNRAEILRAARVHDSLRDVSAPAHEHRAAVPRPLTGDVILHGRCWSKRPCRRWSAAAAPPGLRPA